jgi:hypothetical protein
VLRTFFDRRCLAGRPPNVLEGPFAVEATGPINPYPVTVVEVHDLAIRGALRLLLGEAVDNRDDPAVLLHDGYLRSGTPGWWTRGLYTVDLRPARPPA